MSNANPSRLGQANASGDVLALFLKVAAGEVLTAFDRASAFRQRHLVRVIPNGKSAAFPATGLASAQYHTPGSEILGDVVRHNERVITIDDLLVAPVFVANIDEAMNYYDVRSIYTGEIGQALAKAYDQNVGRVHIQAARGSSIIDGIPGGGHSNDAGYSTDGTKLFTGIFNAGVALDANDIPGQDRSAFVRPVQYALIVQSEKPINWELNELQRNGGYDTGRVGRINDIAIVKTNNLPSLDDRVNADIPSDRRADYSVSQALIAHRSAAGTAQLQDVTMETAYDIRRQGNLMVGKYLVGHGVLRPESAYELRTADPAA